MSSERVYGQVIGPIPWSKIMLYGCRYQLTPAMMDTLAGVVRHLDEVWLEWQRENQRSAAPGKKNKNGGQKYSR